MITDKKQVIYLDYAAHTPPSPAALEAFARAERDFGANPLSSHAAGLSARAELERCRERIARVIGVPALNIIFASSASEANAMAIRGLIHARRHIGRHVITTCLEHPSVHAAFSELDEVELARVTPGGTVDLEHVRELLRSDTALVSVCHVDGELGAVQPIAELAALLKGTKTAFHSDGVQSRTWLPTDATVLSPHKFGGLTGIAAIITSEELPPLYRTGTPSVGLAASFAAALENPGEPPTLRETLWERLSRYPEVRINSPRGGSPYILNLSVKGRKGDRFQQLLSERGVCVSVKSACSARGTPSRAVMAVSDRANALCSWRISLGSQTTKAEIERFLAVFEELLHDER
ncbi:aminotransferase V [Clostridia bacterium]|nr:aminotransferase V [Clostridia bacterium]